MPQKVEGVVDQSVLSARRQLRLQFGKIGAAFMGDDHFPVDDGFSGDIKCAGNHREPLGPVQSVAGEDLLPTAVDVDLDAVAVKLDLMKPLLALRRSSSLLKNPVSMGFFLVYEGSLFERRDGLERFLA